MNLEILIRKGRVRGLSDESILDGIRFHYDMYVAFIQDNPIAFRLYKDTWHPFTTPQFEEETEYRIYAVEGNANEYWDTIPDCINYIAKDDTGAWWGYDDEPEYNEDFGVWRVKHGTSYPLEDGDLPKDIREEDMLLERPL